MGELAMGAHIALLRAVNLAGHGAVAMSDLRAVLERLELVDPRTLLQSGNAVFGASRATPASLERLIEAELRKRLTLETGVFVRTADEWRAIVDRNPFRKEAARDPAHLTLLVMKDAPGKEAVKTLQAAIKGREYLEADGRQAYVVYPDGIGRSKLTHTLIEKHLGTRGTARNWNTVLKLQSLADQR